MTGVTDGAVSSWEYGAVNYGRAAMNRTTIEGKLTTVLRGHQTARIAKILRDADARDFERMRWYAAHPKQSPARKAQIDSYRARMYVQQVTRSC